MLSVSAILLLLCVTSHTTAKPLHREARGLAADADKITPSESKKEETNTFISVIAEKKDDELVLFQGDIIIQRSELMDVMIPRVKRQSNHGSGELPPILIESDTVDPIWPNCEVPYKYDTILPSSYREIFMNAMKMWEDGTCIDFVPARPEHSDYLLLKRTDICSSSIGRKGIGSQDVTIAEDCNRVGDAVHELGHAIGLWHEHSRSDRDQYIRIHYENIDSNEDESNFNIVNSDNFKLNIKYDIQSIMHYGPFEYALSNEPGAETISVREDADLELGCGETLQMGQREELSFRDKQRASLLYGCEFTLEEPICPTPTTDVTTEAKITTTMPTPSVTMATDPPPDNKLWSGSTIALTFGGGGYGMECVPSPGCTPLPCKNYGGNSCEDLTHQFEIVNYETSKRNKRIKSETTVLLRSFRTRSRWLDCSDPESCVISDCPEDNPDDPSNASYVSNCSRHQFQVSGVGRGANKVLNSKNKLKFKYSDSEEFLTCNGRKCHTLADGHCPDPRVAKVAVTPDDNGQCENERFSVIKLE